jgi:hypothetical protein
MAYDHLRDETKDGILPIFELSRRMGAESHSLQAAIDLVHGVIPERPFILDIDKRAAPQPYVSQHPANPTQDAARVAVETAAMNAFNAELNALLRPEQGFAAWRALSDTYANAVPVLQFTNINTQLPDILHQATALTANNRSIAIRVRHTLWQEICALIAQIIGVIPSAQHLLIIFDCGQGRSGIDAKIQFIAEAVDAILAQFSVGEPGALTAVCMSNSYAQPGHDGLRTIANRDWEIWQGARAIIPIAFGDYAATSRDRTLSSWRPFDWRATIVHSRPEAWDIYRHVNANDANGFIVGSQAIVAMPEYQSGGSWCDQLIDGAAQGNIAGFESPRFWHAARTNGHIERQLLHARTRTAAADIDDLLG